MYFGKKEKLLALITISASLSACAYLKKDVVKAPCVIGTTVSYNTDVAPIIQANCFQCHSSASNISGILLETHAELKAYAQNGFLYGTINHASGFSEMPQGAAKLDDCTIATIKQWIDDGAPNN